MRWSTGIEFTQEDGEDNPGSQVPSLISATVLVPGTKRRRRSCFKKVDDTVSDFIKSKDSEKWGRRAGGSFLPHHGMVGREVHRGEYSLLSLTYKACTWRQLIKYSQPSPVTKINMTQFFSFYKYICFLLSQCQTAQMTTPNSSHSLKGIPLPGLAWSLLLLEHHG